MTMPDTIFDRIAAGTLDAYIIWQDDHYMAFLTPFPNTPGMTVVIPRTNQGDYVFDLDNDQYQGLMQASKTVAKLLEKALGVKRVALVYEGTGVAYVHAKLYPLYGPLASQTDVWSDHTEFVEEYRGYITTIEGPKMPDEQLKAIQAKIIASTNS